MNNSPFDEKDQHPRTHVHILILLILDIICQRYLLLLKSFITIENIKLR